MSCKNHNWSFFIHNKISYWIKNNKLKFWDVYPIFFSNSIQTTVTNTIFFYRTSWHLFKNENIFDLDSSFNNLLVSTWLLLVAGTTLDSRIALKLNMRMGKFWNDFSDFCFLSKFFQNIMTDTILLKITHICSLELY